MICCISIILGSGSRKGQVYNFTGIKKHENIYSKKLAAISSMPMKKHKNEILWQCIQADFKIIN